MGTILSNKVGVRDVDIGDFGSRPWKLPSGFEDCSVQIP